MLLTIFTLSATLQLHRLWNRYLVGLASTHSPMCPLSWLNNYICLTDRQFILPGPLKWPKSFPMQLFWEWISSLALLTLRKYLQTADSRLTMSMMVWTTSPARSISCMSGILHGVYVCLSSLLSPCLITDTIFVDQELPKDHGRGVQVLETGRRGYLC